MFSALLITGGVIADVDGVYHSAEVFLPFTSTSCKLPGMVFERYGHTLDNLLACGGCCVDTGYGEFRNCEEFSPATGLWTNTFHTLQEERYGHVSWSVEEGTLLMGGDSGYTSEIVKHDGTTETSFDMRSLT